MKMRYCPLALAATCALAGRAWADEAAAKKWVDGEFQPSTLSRTSNSPR
jgi:glycerol transport system substrate-binding protein